MDELTTVEVKKILEDNVEDNVLRYNSTLRYDGKANSDSGGNISISKFRMFDGKANYDGGDINYFNGAIKADGKFTFEGGGNRAKIETLTDDISGKLTNAKAEKETPPVYAEVFEYVPLTVEKDLTLLTVDAIKDIVDETTDTYPTTLVSKVVSYTGAIQYNGGDLNHFDGSIKADGKFGFDSGNKAKIEIIALDLDGKFTLQRNKKSDPIPYVEQFDFVPKVGDEVRTDMQTIFEESVHSSDGGGSLSIRRRTRFDGRLRYCGYFEDKIRQFNGCLNYNGLYKVETDGSTRIDGSERYGGRLNSSVIEYVTDLDGNEQVIELDKIPVATRQQLGYIIVGDNIDVDDSGKISLPKKDFMPINNLKSIFDEWRQRNEI